MEQKREDDPRTRSLESADKKTEPEREEVTRRLIDSSASPVHSRAVEEIRDVAWGFRPRSTEAASGVCLPARDFWAFWRGGSTSSNGAPFGGGIPLPHPPARRGSSLCRPRMGLPGVEGVERGLVASEPGLDLGEMFAEGGRFLVQGLDGVRGFLASTGHELVGGSVHGIGSKRARSSPGRRRSPGEGMPSGRASRRGQGDARVLRGTDSEAVETTGGRELSAGTWLGRRVFNVLVGSQAGGGSGDTSDWRRRTDGPVLLRALPGRGWRSSRRRVGARPRM